MENSNDNDETKENEELSDTDKLMELVLNTREQCEMLEKILKKQLEIKDHQINQLHDELQYYKQENGDKYVKEVIKSVIKVRRDMKKLLNSSKLENITAEKMKDEYEYIFEDLSDVLLAHNIEEFITSKGELFDSSRQTAQMIEKTSDPLLDKTIKESLKEGYKMKDKILIAERVAVYKFEEKKEI